MSREGQGIGVDGGRERYFRTDLACECQADEGDVKTRTLTLGGDGEVHILDGKDAEGRHITLQTPPLTLMSDHAREMLAGILVESLAEMARHMLGRDLRWDDGVLVVGLGNPDMTPDALGPRTLGGLTVTRHLRQCDPLLYQALGCCELSALSPLVLGQTGIESGEIVRGVLPHVKPCLVVAVDALAAGSCERLGRTFQISDRGISPGAGVGNHRMGICRESMGVPVMAVGVPTVVDSATLVYDALARAGMGGARIPEALETVLESGRSFVVSPKDADLMVEVCAEILARGLNMAFGVSDA